MMIRLKVLRQQRELSQWNLARLAGVSQGRYSMLERGLIAPTPEERAALAAALRSSPAGLFRQLPEPRTASALRSTEPGAPA
jgi:transcriptional regulator with XRE-family HTH domain